MGISYEPSISEQIGPAAFEAFSKGLSKMLQPHHDFQIAMQKAVGSNPQLAQQLADLEYNAPGTLDRMGFGNLGKVIAAVPESEKSQFLRTSRGDILKADKQALQGQITQGGFDLDRLNDTINFLKDPKNVAVKSDEILNRLTGQTSAQRQETQAKADTATASGAVAKKAYEDALAKNPELQKTDFLSLARDFAAKKEGSSQLVSAAFATPGASEAMNAAMQIVQDEATQAFRERLAGVTKGKEEDDLLTRQAFAAYQATKRAGTLDAWKVILKDPNKVIEARAKDPSKLTQPERDIIQAANAQEQMQNMVDVQEIQRQNTAISGPVTAIAQHVAVQEARGGDIDKGFITAQVSNLNTALVAAGKNITARFGKIPDVGAKEASGWFKPTGIYYVDAQGKRVSDDEVVVRQPNSVSADALRAFSEIQGVPENLRQQAWDNLKKANPSLYDEVSKMKKP